MKFIDHEALGVKLVESMTPRKLKDSIIVCLHPDSLMTSLTVASQLHGWVFPLIYAPVYSDDVIKKTLGAFDQNGNFFSISDSISTEGTSSHSSEYTPTDSQRTHALESIKQQLSNYKLTLDNKKLIGRHVYFVINNINDTTPIEAALHLIKDVTPGGISFLVGNTTPELAQLINLYGQENVILDIVTGTEKRRQIFDKLDRYSENEQYEIARNISTFWK